MAAASKAVEREEHLDGFESLSFRLTNVLLAERQRLQASNLARRVRLPQGTLTDAGSSLLVVMPGFEPGVRRFDSCPRSSQEQMRTKREQRSHTSPENKFCGIV